MGCHRGFRVRVLGGFGAGVQAGSRIQGLSWDSRIRVWGSVPWGLYFEAHSDSLSHGTDSPGIRVGLSSEIEQRQLSKVSGCSGRGRDSRAEGEAVIAVACMSRLV